MLSDTRKIPIALVRGPMDTLVDADEALDAEPPTERTPPPNPADYPASETRIGLFGLTDAARAGVRHERR